ncbi:MAG: 50S ribosomal protein L22 [Burkholderiales bacterium]
MSTPQAQAKLRYLLTSPPKVRQMCGLIQGLEVEQARQQLELTARGAAPQVLKLLNSAVANAEHNDGADIDVLKVKSVLVERGSFLKRFHARAKGRGTRVQKHSCNIYVTVGD